MKIRPRHPMRNSMFRISALAVFLVSCSTHQIKSAPDTLDTQSLIRVPAQLGAAGVDQVTSALQARYGVASGTPLSPFANSKAPVSLDDGVVIVQTVTNPGARDVRLDLAAKPCLPIARAAEWIGAKRMLATAGSDIITGHADYRFDSVEVRIDLTGDYGDQECLRVIEIYKQ
jgi:hypothetical protein